MKNKKFLAGLFSLFLIVALAACNGNNDGDNKDKNNDNAAEQTDKNKNDKDQANTVDHENMDDMDHMDMHNDSGDVPEGLTKADNPKYEVGSKVIINADHMKGMKDAEATVVGAYDTNAYTLTYTPTDGGEKVENHKWIIQEELKDAGDKQLAKGTEVTIEADHMKGMKGAKATIDSVEKTTVYMLDYKPTTGGEEVKNHKWVVERELSPKK